MMRMWQSMTRNWQRPQKRNGMGFFSALLLGTGLGIAASRLMRSKGLRKGFFNLILPGNRQTQAAQ